MPFKKVGRNRYVSPSGRHWTGAQVRLYYATKGFTKKPKRAREVNHCHGSAPGHPCGGAGGKALPSSPFTHGTRLGFDPKTGRLILHPKTPKRFHPKIDKHGRLTLFEALTPEALLAEEWARLLEQNDCHNPEGPGGGRFCHHSRKAMGQRARKVLAKVGRAAAAGGSAVRQRSLAHRQAVASQVLQHLRKTGFLGTLFGTPPRASTIRREGHL